MFVMKKLGLVFCCCLLLTAMTCTRDSDTEHHHILFYNASEYDIYINLSFYYPDTSLVHEQNVMTPGWNYKVTAHSVNNDAFENCNSYEVEFGYMYDTIIVFIYNSDTLALYGWDYVKEHNLIAQRYDLSLDNLQQLDWRLQFPPSSKMQHIKMWPPYGTYDSLGHRIE